MAMPVAEVAMRGAFNVTSVAAFNVTGQEVLIPVDPVNVSDPCVIGRVLAAVVQFKVPVPAFANVTEVAFVTGFTTPVKLV
jgi:hypothetical protein